MSPMLLWFHGLGKLWGVTVLCTHLAAGPIPARSMFIGR